MMIAVPSEGAAATQLLLVEVLQSVCFKRNEKLKFPYMDQLKCGCGPYRLLGCLFFFFVRVCMNNVPLRLTFYLYPEFGSPDPRSGHPAPGWSHSMMNSKF